MNTPQYRIVPKTLHANGDYELWPDHPTLWSVEQASPGNDGHMEWYVVSDHPTVRSARRALQRRAETAAPLF